jgi:hypothetical protein
LFSTIITLIIEKVSLESTTKNANNLITTNFCWNQYKQFYRSIFLSYANTGNNRAPVPQQFVNLEPGESIADLYSF